MKRFHIRSTEAGTLLASLLVVASLIPGSCASKRSQDVSNKTPAASSGTDKPIFDVRGGRRIEKVTINTGKTSRAITPKADLGFVVVEVRLREENENKPVPANFSAVELVDSAGARYKPLFSYPSALSKCEPDCEAITFTNDPSRLIGGRLSELGGTLVVVFSAPTDIGEFKVEIADSPTVEIKVGAEK